MKIHFMRHGKTRANEGRLYCGSTDLGLSENGKQEVEALKTSGYYPAGDFFVTSGMRRTKETLELIYGNVSSTEITQLREYDFGEFEMHSHHQLVSSRPEISQAYTDWIERKAPPPGGEGHESFEQRIRQGFQLLNESADGRQSVVVVTHGGVIARLMGFLFPDTANFYEWQPKPAHFITLVCEGENYFIEGK